MRQKLLLLAAVFFGVIAFVLTYNQIEYEKRKALGAAKDVAVMKLTRTLSAGDTIKESDLSIYKTKRFDTNISREIPWEKRMSAISRKASWQLDQGHVLEWIDLEDAPSSQSGLAPLIPAGMRAISIAVDSTSSVTGLIQPGNKVDVVGTFRFPDAKGDKSMDTLTLTILQNVYILATGTDMGRANLGRNAKSSSAAGTPSRGYSSVSMALTPKEVEFLVFASQKGRLTLSLRNPEDTQIENELQSVNFDFLQKNIQKYMHERENLLKRLKPYQK